MRRLIGVVAFIFAISIFYHSSGIEAGTVEISERCDWYVLGECEADFRIKGTISKNIEEEIHKKIRNIKNRGDKLRNVTVTVDSSGGDVYTAMRIGRLLKQEEASVIVPQRSSCLSSCVLILAGGAKRWVHGKVGIHRPYFYDFPKDLKDDQIKPALNKLWSDVRAYLVEMNVPSSLFEEMVSIPPAEIKILSDSDLSRFCLNQADPVWEEKWIRNQSKSYGLTAAEFRRRDAIADRACQDYILDSSKHWKCRESILFGISMEEYEKGVKRLEKVCKSPKRPAPREVWETYKKCVQNFWKDYQKRESVSRSQEKIR